MPRAVPIPPKSGQESVWEYPRPPRLEPVSKRIRIVFNGETIAESANGRRVLETSHPPVYYLPPSDVRTEFLIAKGQGSLCEWKGTASYFSVAVNGKEAYRAAWSYPDPTACFSEIKDHFAFYAGPVDLCTVDGEEVTPQPGGFYGGWITPDVVGPFKGEPGTMGW